MPTSRNAMGIDIIAYRPDGKSYIGIQVKTLTESKNQKWDVSAGEYSDEGIEKIAVPHYWVIVILNEIYACVLPRKDMTGDPVNRKAIDSRKKLVQPPVRTGKNLWIVNTPAKKSPEMPHYNCDKYRDRWDLIQ